MKSNPPQIAAPNLNRRCERVILPTKFECLQKSIDFGRRHLVYIVSQCLTCYNPHCSHRERDYLPPIRDVLDEAATTTMDEIDMPSYIGG